MKQNKQFKVGNKVFAKVKGYPAWPARIEEEQGKNKYRVTFYGTGEVGAIKAEDLFLYSERKEQFTKNLKRKDYNDAIEQIEAAIKAEGEGDTSLAKTDSGEKRGIKRKSSLDSSINENEPKKPSIESKKTPQNKKSLSPKKVKDETTLEESNKKNNNTDSAKKSSRKKLNTSEVSDDSMEVENKAQNEETAKFVIVSSDQLQKTIEECSKILMKMDDKEEINAIPEEMTTLESNAILLARVDYGKYTGIKINHNRPTHFKNGVERLQWAVDNSQRVLDLKEKVETSMIKPEDDPDLYELDCQLTKEQLENEQGFRFVERKKNKLLWLKIECCLIELDNKIKTNLGLDKADPDKALKYLDDMLKLTIDPLMLKKHHHVVDMVKRLRRYFGNVKEWKLQENELEKFKEKAEEIRRKAEGVYKKFQSLFEVPENTSFSEVFAQQLEKFKSLTKNMTESQVFALCAEPGSKQAIWDELDEQEEIRLMSEKLATKKDKENISENANFEGDSQNLNQTIESEP